MKLPREWPVPVHRERRHIFRYWRNSDLHAADKAVRDASLYSEGTLVEPSHMAILIRNIRMEIMGYFCLANVKIGYEENANEKHGISGYAEKLRGVVRELLKKRTPRQVADILDKRASFFELMLPFRRRLLRIPRSLGSLQAPWKREARYVGEHSGRLKKMIRGIRQFFRERKKRKGNC